MGASLQESLIVNGFRFSFDADKILASNFYQHQSRKETGEQVMVVGDRYPNGCIIFLY